jgi:hypothetical protein
MIEFESEKIEILINRKYEIQDRRVIRELEIIQIKRSLQEITTAEAALKEEKIKAKTADSLIERRQFKTSFCQLYQENKSMAEAIEGVAEAVMIVITQFYPAWMTNLTTASGVAVLAAVILIRRGINLYCTPYLTE